MQQIVDGFDADLPDTFSQQNDIAGVHQSGILRPHAGIVVAIAESDFCKNSVCDGHQGKNTQRIQEVLEHGNAHTHRSRFVDLADVFGGRDGLLHACRRRQKMV